MAAFKDFGAIPDLSGNTTEETLKKIEDYLYLLREQMSYVLSNLGVENINHSSLNEMKTLFTEEIAGKIENSEGDIASLQLTAEALNLSLQDAGGGLSALEQTVEGLTLSVKDRNGKTSAVSLRGGALDLSELVFTVLATNGATKIDGGNITTGIINAVSITSCRITSSEFNTSGSVGQVQLSDGEIGIYNQLGYSYGKLYYDGFGYVNLTTSGQCKLAIYSDYDLLINARSGRGIYIGTSASTTQGINIGNGNSGVNLKGTEINLSGTVKINGTTLPY